MLMTLGWMRAGCWHDWLVAVVSIVVFCACTSANKEHEGEKWVHGIHLKGTHALDDGDIKDKLATEKTGWWPFAKKKWFDEAVLDYDLQRIEAYGAEHGYFQTRVTQHVVTAHGQSAVDIDITVDEGQPTLISAVTYTGLPSVLDAKRPPLSTDLDIKIGDVFNHAVFEASKAQLLTNLKSQGYAYAQVTAQAEVDRSAHIAVLTFHVQSGPAVHLGQPTLIGNGKLPADKILRRLTWTPGDLYSPDQISESENRFYALGVLSSVSTELPQQPTSDAPVNIRVTPGSLYELRLGGGVGIEQFRQDVRLRAEWTLHNFLGDLRTLRLRIQPAYVFIPTFWSPDQRGPAVSTDAQIVQPDLYKTNITAHALVGFDLDVQPGYQYYGPRGQVGIDRFFLENHVDIGVNYNIQYLTFFGLLPGFDTALTPLGNSFSKAYRLAWFEEYIQLDLRDNKFYPTRGIWVELRSEQGLPAIGSNFSYVKLTPDFRFYIPAGRRVVLAGRLMLGWLHPDSAGDDPITRRYELGGPDSDRGFSLGRLSPEIHDINARYYPAPGIYIPVGGDGAVLGSFETRFRMVKLGGNWFDSVAFLDAGDVTPAFSQLNLRDLNVSVGGSLAYETPIGAVRAGLGVRLNRLNNVQAANGETKNPDPGDRFALHITVGEAF